MADDEKQDLIPAGQLQLPATLYLGIDGTGVPMRTSELKGRGGKQCHGEGGDCRRETLSSGDIQFADCPDSLLSALRIV